MSEAITSNIQAPTPAEFITTASGTNMVMGGPLAQAYSEGLDQLYAKERTEEGVALESQQQDQEVARRAYILSKKPLLDTDDRANMSIFYGVHKGAVHVPNVIDVVDALSTMNDTQRQRSAIIIDSFLRPNAGQAPHVEHDVVLHPSEQALRDYCAKYNVPVYSSMNEFVSQHG